jgi:hypothetical protein
MGPGRPDHQGRPKAARELIGLSPRPRPSWLPEKFDRVNIQDIGQLSDYLQAHIGGRPLDPAQVGPVYPRLVGQPLLRHLPSIPDASEVGREQLAKVHVPN